MKKLLMILLFLASAAAYGQRITISGTVTDESGTALPGATVQVKGTSQGVLTGADGKYSIDVANPNATLVISFVGYVAQELPIGGQTALNASLKEDIQGLQEVVVVGYGTQKKANLTGSVDQVTSDALENRPMMNLTQGLKFCVTFNRRDKHPAVIF